MKFVSCFEPFHGRSGQTFTLSQLQKEYVYIYRLEGEHRSITTVNNTSTKRRKWSLITGRGAATKQEGGGASEVFTPTKTGGRKSLAMLKNV